MQFTTVTKYCFTLNLGAKPNFTSAAAPRTATACTHDYRYRYQYRIRTPLVVGRAYNGAAVYGINVY